MSKVVFLGNFDNYFNRQVKYKNQYSYLNGYGNVQLRYPVEGVNFNPNDGITTELIVNWNPAESKFWTPDYMLEVDDSILYDQDTNPVLSRWFVVEFQRTRNGQYKASLKRDTIVDNYDKVISSPAFIEKATVSPDNPLIFNSEGMTFNQIKKEEIPLKDETGMAWIVGYCAKNETRYPETGTYQTRMDIGNVILKSEIPSVIQGFISDRQVKIAKYKDTDDYFNYKFYGRVSFIAEFKYEFDYHYNQYALYRNNITDQSWWDELWLNEQTDYYKITHLPIIDETNWDPFLNNLPSNLTEPEQLKKVQKCIKTTIQDKLFNYRTNINSNLRAYIDVKDSRYFNEVIKYNGLTYYDPDTQKYYMIKMNIVDKEEIVDVPGIPSNSSLINVKNYTQSAFVSGFDEDELSDYINSIEFGSDTVIRYKYPISSIEINVEEIPAAAGSVVNAYISATRNHLVDQPFDMFCIPYGPLKCSDFVCDPQIGLAAAQSLAQAEGIVYDIQILPYCPLRSIITSDTVYELAMTEDVDYSYITYTTGSDTNNSIIFWCRNSTFSFDILQELNINRETATEEVKTYDSLTWIQDNSLVSIPQSSETGYAVVSYIIGEFLDHPDRTVVGFVNQTEVLTGEIQTDYIHYNPNTCTLNIKYTKLNTGGGALIRPKVFFTYYTVSTPTVYKNSLAIDTKISNECDIYRLMSPNYASIFEFSIAKNGGIEYFNVDCTYKPYTPYIHINPNFKELYGEDFNDSRGLILSGDFSLSLVTDAWETYELQHKNYQLMFDRGIKNMDVQKQYSRVSNLLNGGDLSNIVGGGASGLNAGGNLTSMVSRNILAGATGSVTGAVIGAGLAAGKSLANYALSEAAYKENRSFAKDMFNYNLGNIQALPDSLTNVGCLNENFKFFPFIEYYTCTDTEKNIFTNKLKWNGMTVMAIGSINEYKRPQETFMKGQFIRLEGLNDDSHIANDIYDEFNKGLFI